jgi:integrase
MLAGADRSLLTLNLFRAARGRPPVSVEADMSVTMRMLAPAVTGEPRCHFLVQWRDSHAIQHGRTFPTWQEAAAFDAAIKAGRLPRDAPGRRAALTFGAAAARWLATKQATKRPSTADLYATELRCHVLPAFAGRPLPDITRRDVQEWVNTLAAAGLAPATVRHAYRAVFKSVLTDAIDDGLLARSPCHRIELPAAPVPVIEPLTPAQILTLATLIDPRYRAMVLLGAGCGLRWSEAAGLTRDRIHLGTRAQVTIDRQLGYRPATTRHSPQTASRSLFAPPKTSASCRVIPLPAAVTAALRAHLRAYPPGPAGLLFTTPAGDVLNPANWRQRTWRPLVRSAPGIPAGTTFHRLRHAYASLLGDAALPDHDIQRRLGHAHPGEVRWYRHPYPDPGDGQATRDAIDTALTAAQSGREQAAAC